MEPILCLDFDGVIHSYTTPWSDAKIIPDPLVPGAMQFIAEAAKEFTVAIYSSRMSSYDGRVAVIQWVLAEIYKHFGESEARDLFASIKFPEAKPPAFVTLDDRAITFTGIWPDLKALKEFKPWNKC